MATMKRRHIPLSEKQPDYDSLINDEYNDSFKEKTHKYQPQPQPIVYSSNKVRWQFFFKK